MYAAMPAEQTLTHVSTPFQLGFDEKHSLYPKEYGVHGLRLNSFFVENRFMYGLDIGFWNVSGDAGGLQIAVYRNETHNFGGIQLALWNAETEDVRGLQFATVTTDAGDLYGLQLTGLLGKARAVHGIQIGGLSAVSESENDDARTSGFQAGLYEARAENLTGIQLGGIFSETEWNANGLQAAVLFAESRYTRGIQLGCLTATSQEASGIQIGGLMARSEINAHGIVQAGLVLARAGEMEGGLQLSGIASNVIGESRGVQISVISTMAASVHGTEIAGIWNYAFEDVNGAQAALVYNHARSVHGVQIGLFNYCERLDGLQIGLVNIVRESSFPAAPLLRFDF
jgi:hypothetical protein